VGNEAFLPKICNPKNQCYVTFKSRHLGTQNQTYRFFKKVLAIDTPQNGIARFSDY
jgi:hypothetical protein